MYEKQIIKTLNMPYQWVFVPEEFGGYSAKILEFSGCFAYGDDIKEAEQNLKRAAESWLLAVLERGQDVPAPRGHER